ncbi:putative RNA polymerase II subunit B1 CTD phosphatase RPAP2 homolog [Planococcus citri]|uniref:putative RNA polymerase II subunit B1 CTD phosphatase RPAP2 homolog n=1 Tax=Planococcus citri TaxID=170843 RepID=UPI0031F90F08
MASSISPNPSPRSPKPSARSPKPDRRRALLAAKKKKECNARAQKVVEEFIDGTNDQTYFLSQLRWINQSHYQDIIEERTIMKHCGYPLCSQILGPVPKQKYHISTTENKVYDITERKSFCSNQCYKASIFLKNQLYTSPLWLREKEPVPNFTLFHSSMVLTVEDIDFGIDTLRITDDLERSAPDSSS